MTAETSPSRMGACNGEPQSLPKKVGMHKGRSCRSLMSKVGTYFDNVGANIALSKSQLRMGYVSHNTCDLI